MQVFGDSPVANLGIPNGHFRWPTEGSDQTLTLTGEELGILLSSTRVELKIKRSEVFERNTM